MNIQNKKIENIFCKYFYPTNNIEKIVIAVHGFAGDKDSSVIEAIANKLNQNTLVVTFDLPCHGEDNTNSVLQLNQCLHYLDVVISSVKKEYKDKEISIFATSFGAFLTLNYLKNSIYTFNHIILRAPAIFMDKVLVNSILRDRKLSYSELIDHEADLGINKKIMVDKKFLQDLKNNNLSSYQFKTHIDIIQGDQDDIVDVKENENYYKSNFISYNLYYIKGADHRFKKAGELEQILDIVTKIIK